MMTDDWDMPDHMREDIFKLHRRGIPIVEIADILGLNKDTVLAVLKPAYWTKPNAITVVPYI